MVLADFEVNWDDDRIAEIENSLMQAIFNCRSTEAVEAAITYAKFLSSVGISPENYPVFLKILEIENHWVIDALIGERDPFLMLSSVQPNTYIVNRIFAMMTKWHKGGIYSANISVILGVLQSVYGSPKDGFRIYPLSIADLNALGKHLNKETGQDDPLNRVILEIVGNLSRLEGKNNSDEEEVAIYASAIQNAFFDNRKKLEDVIPPVLLVTTFDRTEIPPRKLSQSPTSSSDAKPQESTKPQESQKHQESQTPHESKKPQESTEPQESKKPQESTEPQESTKPQESTADKGAKQKYGKHKPKNRR